MTTVRLTSDQAKLVQQLQQGVEQLRVQFKSGRFDDRTSQRIVELGDVAHKLHMSLKDAGTEPRHHRYMIENRGLQPDDPKFYHHFHPIEDLLKFIEDPSANEDPEDQTIGAEFRLTVFSHRWGHEDEYKVKRTRTGWDVHFISIGGKCDRAGRPYLFQNLDHDGISYPADLGDWLEWLWLQARDRGLSQEEVQRALDQLGEWISSVESSAPRDGIWERFK